MAKILVVDDSSLSRRVSRRILEAAGHAVTDVADGFTALERYSLDKPDLVLLDVTMAEMDGLEVLRQLRMMDPSAVVVMATADVQTSTRTLAEAGGASGFVIKPLTAEAVLQAVDGALTAQGGTAVTLTEDQKDAVTELVNIAFSRTAAALSELTGNRVELTVPEVSGHPIANLLPALGRFVRGEVATVHQIFGGPVSGDAFLILDIEGASQLVDLLTEAGAPTTQMGASAREVLAEVGNILLNACLGVFGDQLQVRFTFAVPRLHLDSLGSMLDSLVIGTDEIRHALLIGTRFRVRASEVTGCMVLVLGVTSLDVFIQGIENWAERVTHS